MGRGAPAGRSVETMAARAGHPPAAARILAFGLALVSTVLLARSVVIDGGLHVPALLALTAAAVFVQHRKRRAVRCGQPTRARDLERVLPREAEPTYARGPSLLTTLAHRARSLNPELASLLRRARPRTRATCHVHVHETPCATVARPTQTAVSR